MSKQLEKVLRIKDEFDKICKDIQADYPINNEVDHDGFPEAQNQRIYDVALNVESLISNLPEKSLKKALDRKLSNLHEYKSFKEDVNGTSKLPRLTSPGYLEFKEVNPLLKNVLNQLYEYYTDDIVELRSTADIAFKHLQKSIIVNKVQKEEWQDGWENNNLETRFEKLGDTHLLSHNIWSAKFNTKGAGSDSVLVDPTFETKIDLTDGKYQTGKGLLLTEWKVCRTPKTVDKSIDGAIQQAKQYCTTHFSGFEFARLCYIVIVSEDYVDIGTSDRFIEGITFRVVNIACIPSSPSKHAKKAHNT